MLNNQVSTLCFSSTALPTDYDALKQKKNESSDENINVYSH